jgi:hypothetical protein
VLPSSAMCYSTVLLLLLLSKQPAQIRAVYMFHTRIDWYE